MSTCSRALRIRVPKVIGPPPRSKPTRKAVPRSTFLIYYACTESRDARSCTPVVRDLEQLLIRERAVRLVWPRILLLHHFRYALPLSSIVNSDGEQPWRS